MESTTSNTHDQVETLPPRVQEVLSREDDRDRAYFEAHPERVALIRYCAPEEYWPEVPEEPVEPLMLVWNVGSGVRLRWLFWPDL